MGKTRSHVPLIVRVQNALNRRKKVNNRQIFHTKKTKILGKKIIKINKYIRPYSTMSRKLNNKISNNLNKEISISWRFPINHIILHKSYLKNRTAFLILVRLFSREIKSVSINKKKPFKILPESAYIEITTALLIAIKDLKKPKIITSISNFILSNYISKLPSLNGIIKNYIQENILNKKTRYYKRFIRTKNLCSYLSFIEKFKDNFSLEKAKKALKDKLNKKIQIGKIIVVMKRTNMFLTLLTKKNQVKGSFSTGFAKYTGKQKVSESARLDTARLIAKHARRHNIRIVDINYQKHFGKFYRPITLGFIRNILLIRRIRMNVKRPHGHMRFRKQRRI